MSVIMEVDVLELFSMLNETDSANRLIEDIVETKAALSINLNYLNQKHDELKTENREVAARDIHNNIARIKTESLRAKSRLVRYSSYLDNEIEKLETTLTKVDKLTDNISFTDGKSGKRTSTNEQITALLTLLFVKKELLSSLIKYKPDIQESLKAITDFEDYTIFAVMESVSKVKVQPKHEVTQSNTSALVKYQFNFIPKVVVGSIITVIMALICYMII